MDLKNKLDQQISKWALLNHPFYKAWEMGELPVDALRTYAREYGAFIRLMPNGWETLNDGETASEEREHAELWQDFAAGLDTQIAEAELPAVQQLVGGSTRLFSEKETAMGALYAFEAQQPATATSKLAGLRKHYALPVIVEPYFEQHSANHHEAAKLLAGMETLPAEEQERAIKACGEMSEALWNALSDIYDAHKKM